MPSTLFALSGATRHYGGLSIDARPVGTTGAPIPPGSLFHEFDSRLVFEWDGYKWALADDERQDRKESLNLLRELVGLQRDMLDELTALRRILDS